MLIRKEDGAGETENSMTIRKIFIVNSMGLLTILKKMKQKEKEMRILMLYPFMRSVLYPFAISYFWKVKYGMPQVYHLVWRNKILNCNLDCALQRTW